MKRIANQPLCCKTLRILHGSLFCTTNAVLINIFETCCMYAFTLIYVFHFKVMVLQVYCNSIRAWIQFREKFMISWTSVHEMFIILVTNNSWTFHERLSSWTVREMERIVKIQKFMNTTRQTCIYFPELTFPTIHNHIYMYLPLVPVINIKVASMPIHVLWSSSSYWRQANSWIPFSKILQELSHLHVKNRLIGDLKIV